MNCPRCMGLLVPEKDSITCDAYLTKNGYHFTTRGLYHRCVNCGFQTDKVMERNRYGS